MKGIIESIKGNKNFMNSNRVEDILEEDSELWKKRRGSMPGGDNDKEELDEGPRSYPLSPKTRKELEDEN